MVSEVCLFDVVHMLHEEATSYKKLDDYMLYACPKVKALMHLNYTILENYSRMVLWL